MTGKSTDGIRAKTGERVLQGVRGMNFPRGWRVVLQPLGTVPLVVSRGLEEGRVNVSAHWRKEILWRLAKREVFEGRSDHFPTR